MNLEIENREVYLLKNILAELYVIKGLDKHTLELSKLIDKIILQEQKIKLKTK